MIVSERVSDKAVGVAPVLLRRVLQIL